MTVRINATFDFNARDIRKARRELDALEKQLTTLSARAQAMSRRFADAGRTMSRVGQQMTRRITLPVIAAGGYAIKTAADFETSFAKIQGLVGVAAEDIAELEAAARRLGPETGKSANEAAEALFFITSAGLQGADAIAVLEASLKASTVGLGETKVVADLVTSTVNAYGSEVLSAAEATDTLTAAVRYGKLEPEELAGSIGQVLPLASAMGVEFHEVGAAFAAMSRTGTDSSKAATQLRQIMATLLNPTQEAREELQRMGLSAEGLRSQLREQGLLATLKTLTDTFGLNDDAIAKVFGNIRALVGVLDLMGANASATEDIFREMADSTGMLDEAFGIAADTAAFQFQQALAELQETLVGVGQDLMPIAQDIVGFIRDLVDRFKDLAPEQQEFITKMTLFAALGLPVAAAIGTIVTAVATLTGALIGMGAAAAVATGGLSLLAGVIAYSAFKTKMMTDEERAAADAARENEAAQRRAALGYDQYAASARLGADAARYAAQADRYAAEQARLAGIERGRAAAAARYAGLAAQYQAEQTEEVTETVEDATVAIGGSGGMTETVVALSDEMREALQDINRLGNEMDNGGEYVAQFARELLAAGSITDEVSQAAVRLAQVVKQDVERALQDANRRLEEATQRFDRYKNAIADGILQGNTLADAASAQSDALRDLANAERDYEDALASGDPERIADAADQLAKAEDAQGSFTDFLAAGADTAQGFADQIDALRLAGASMEVVQEIAELGAKTGGRIIAELLAGGAEAIAQANNLVAATEAAAARAGQAAAQQFYGAGVASAQAFVAAVEASIPALQSVLDQIASMIESALGARPEVRIDGGQTFIPPRPEPTPPSPAPKPRPNVIPAGFDPLKYDWAAEKMAAGGFVDRATFAMVGEAGPEVVMPLDWFEQRYGGGEQVVNITVTSADPQAVVEAIRRYTRSNGPLGSSVVL